MENNSSLIEDIKNFEIPQNSERIIKVIGVGGGGGNAVSHMYKQGIEDVSFALCNTDNQALIKSEIPVKIQLGKETTKGLGAGNKPERAESAAEESREDLIKLLDDGTRMVFITAGMGGGTGTGAAPIIAKIARDMDILTVGIVTIPFLFEGEKKIIQALDGVEKLAENVDALLVINNERLRQIYSDLTVFNAFAKADDTLNIAARSISEIITKHGYMNLDFADVKTTLKDGGISIMSTGTGDGENRVHDSIADALNSPLLNSNDVYNAKKVLLNLYCSEDLQMEEMQEIHRFMAQFTERNIEVIWGLNHEKELGTKVKTTILATGLGVDSIIGMQEMQEERSKQEEEKRLLEEEELHANNTEKILKVYGDSARTFHDARHRRQHSIFIFDVNDLDNDDIIARVEDVPTFERTHSRLKNIQAMSQNSSDDQSYTAKEEPAIKGEEKRRIINF